MGSFFEIFLSLDYYEIKKDHKKSILDLIVMICFLEDTRALSTDSKHTNSSPASQLLTRNKKFKEFNLKPKCVQINQVCICPLPF